MPFCIVNNEYTADPKGHNNPEDFIQILRGEVIKLPSGDNLIRAGYAAPIDATDVGEIVTCKCGRMFSSAGHPHFTQAQFEAELFNAKAHLETLEEGTAGHTEACEGVKGIEKRIAAAKRAHAPMPAEELVAA